VFDSSGPEGKVRGTPQQIIDKYNQLARDAQLSGDRVAAENFQQHAEHYLRLLSEAQKEIDARREEQERQNRERQAERDRERAERQEREANAAPAEDQPQPDVAEQPSNGLEVAGGDETPDAGLVETPEAAPKRRRKPRKNPVEPAEAEQSAAEKDTPAAQPKEPAGEDDAPKAAE